MKVFVCGLLFIALQCLASVHLPRKQLAGPPSEFAARELPVPLSAALSEHSAFLWMNFKRDEFSPSAVSWTRELLVDSEDAFAFTTYLPEETSFDFSLTDPDGQAVDLKPHGQKSFYPIGDVRLPGTTYLFLKDVKKGAWTLTATSKAGVFFGMEDKLPRGAVIMYNHSPTKIFSHLNTYSLKLGNSVGIVSRLTEDELTDDFVPVPMRGVVQDAYMDVVFPDGTGSEVPMYDDGDHADGQANDGIFGGNISATEVGLYSVTAVLKGMQPDGTRFERTTQHIVPVVANEVVLTGFAFSEIAPNSRVHFNMEVEVYSTFGSLDRLFRAYAQVWGEKNGKEVPICWLSAMVEVEDSHNTKIVTLEMDPKWLTKSGAKGPFTLRGVYLQDAYVYVPATQMAAIPVKSTPQVDLLAESLHFDPELEITREMKVGIAPPSMFLRNASSTAPNLLLSHGYCSEGNPWKNSGHAWDRPAFFEDQKANLPNERFADKLLQYAKELNMDAFSIIGHSQGGVVALHLLNYYWSPLDRAKGGRLIQSVGTPWLGNTGAGSAANLVKIFGYGCGANQDLTTDGAALWLSGIDDINRKEVHYYTTTYKQGSLFGDYCNLAVNLVLQWPNDGTSELEYSKLPGGNNEGNKEKWCHTTEMGYPAQYFDADRNKILNEKAAR